MNSDYYQMFQGSPSNASSYSECSERSIIDRIISERNSRNLREAKQLIYESERPQEVFDKLIQDSNRRSLIKETIESFRKDLEEKSRCSESSDTSSVYERLNEDSKNRQNRLRTLQLQKQSQEIDEAKAMNRLTDKKIDKEKVNELVKRLNSDGDRRNRKIELKKKAKEEQEEEERLRILALKHPKRKLNPDVQNRLTQEQHVVEKFYGKPGDIPNLKS